MTSGVMDDEDAGWHPAEKKKEADGKEEANAGFNPAEKKKEIRRKKQKNAPAEVARTGQRGEGSLAELASTGQSGAGAHWTKRGAQDIEDSEITIYDISRYRRKEKEDRKEKGRKEKGRKELGGVAPRVRPTGVGGIGRRGNRA